ncbi:MAG: hypothetical protein LH631_03850 [Alkalinema sp. CAN_BIN05]|nr:hypothetical protein [Alkalinema sp. CAN_BIN05]
MNIFGRVFGGFLVLISLGWLATIAGIRPGNNSNNSNNKINSDPAATNLAAPAKLTTGASPATTSKAQTSSFNAGNTGATNTGVAGTIKPEVEKNPRAATTPGKSDTVKAPSQPTAPAAAPPVAAGW